MLYTILELIKNSIALVVIGAGTYMLIAPFVRIFHKYFKK